MGDSLEVVEEWLSMNTYSQLRTYRKVKRNTTVKHVKIVVLATFHCYKAQLTFGS